MGQGGGKTTRGVRKVGRGEWAQEVGPPAAVAWDGGTRLQETAILIVSDALPEIFERGLINTCETIRMCLYIVTSLITGTTNLIEMQILAIRAIKGIY